MNDKLLTREQYMAMIAFIPESVFYSDNETLINGKSFYRIPMEMYNTIKKKYDEYQERNRKLNRCAELNNKGIALEKSGDIDAAIDVYEENIYGDCYPATHAFDRLCVIYRKRKDYQNEIRVLQKAMEIFSLPKYRERFQKALYLQSKTERV